MTAAYSESNAGGSQRPPAVGPHYLLTALGVRAEEAAYELRGRTDTAPLTPLALLRLLDAPDRPERIVAIVTRKAKNTTWPVLQQQAARIAGVKLEPPIDIPDGRTPEQLRDILARVAQQFPPQCQLTLDVTQGLRHFPFVVYALAVYLTSLQGVRLRGAYYGMLEGVAEGQPHPIINLRPLLELPEWFHAVRVFRDQGVATPIARLIRARAEAMRREAKRRHNDPDLHRQARELERALEALEHHAFAYASGLPLELGKAGWSVAAVIPQLARFQPARDLPLANALANIVTEAAAETAFDQAPPKKGQWKTAVTLDHAELERQARLIDTYLRRRQVSLAVGLMREWVISWTMWRSGQTKDWLTYSRRKPFERRLGALANLAGRGSGGAELTADQREFGQFWDRLCNTLRNSLLHHGMREASIEAPPAALEEVAGFWRRMRAGQVDLPTVGGGGGRLLISPQGARPGVLYSALRAAQEAGRPPDRLLVVCSAQSAATAAEAARRAGYDGPRQTLVLKDPMGGFAEIEPLVARSRQALLDSDEVLANLTGGTTLMGIVVQRHVDMARRAGRAVRRFALIDRRTPAEQEANPYVASESYWLPEGPNDHGHP